MNENENNQPPTAPITPTNRSGCVGMTLKGAAKGCGQASGQSGERELPERETKCYQNRITEITRPCTTIFHEKHLHFSRSRSNARIRFCLVWCFILESGMSPMPKLPSAVYIVVESVLSVCNPGLLILIAFGFPHSSNLCIRKEIDAITSFTLGSNAITALSDSGSIPNLGRIADPPTGKLSVPTSLRRSSCQYSLNCHHTPAASH
ncbi:hypothetical protein V1515DRAFT_611284 [Lipomyces mesembrius]